MIYQTFKSDNCIEISIIKGEKIMKKIILLVVVGILVLSGLGAAEIQKDNTETQQTLEIFTFSEPSFEENEQNQYGSIKLNEPTSYLMNPGEPILPVLNVKYTYPVGTHIKDVTVVFSERKDQVLSRKIMPALAPVPLLEKTVIDSEDIEENSEVYESSQLYPKEPYQYSIHAGLEGQEHVIILNLRCYPVQYSPEQNTIYYAESMDVEVNYELPKDPVVFLDEYDMVIIAPNKFSAKLQPLIDHKNDLGISTTLKTTEEIYDEYDGRDAPEDIKLFIHDVIDPEGLNWGINYVLLVGGMKSLIFGTPRDDVNQGTQSWHLPVRYTNLRDDGGVYDPGYISDLYYADIYKVEGRAMVFDDWDSNDDDVFAKWSNQVGQTDELDHYPDVALGRLACRNTFEVQIVVNKIIAYESTAANPSWFNKMIVVGGDSHDDAGTDFIEGELVGDKALTFMDGFDPIKLYTSYQESDPDNTPTPQNIGREMTAGAGFVLFDGHGHPGSWNTHWNGYFGWDDTPGGISVNRFPLLFNREKLPIVLVGACHNSQFNVTLLGTVLQRPMMWTHGAPVPECWSWWLVRKIGGGSIASFGSTGLGYGYVGNYSDIDGDGNDEPDCLEGLGGYVEITFFRNYDEGIEVLGDLWSATMTDYLDVFPSMGDKIQMKQIQEWPILGDPSLMIGGYS
jgi:hypothetical protein